MYSLDNSTIEINYKEKEIYNILFVRYDCGNNISVWNINEINTNLLVIDFKRNEVEKVNDIVQKIGSSLINKERIENDDINLSSVFNICMSVFNDKLTEYFDYMITKYLNEENKPITLNRFIRYIMNVQVKHQLSLSNLSQNEIFLKCLKFPTQIINLMETNSIKLLKYKMENNENLYQVVKTIGLTKIISVSINCLKSLTEKYIYNVVTENIRFKPTFPFITNYIFYEECVNLKCGVPEFRRINIEYTDIVNDSLANVYLKYNELNTYEYRVDYKHLLIIPKIKEILIKKKLFTQFLKNTTFKIELSILFRIIFNEFSILFNEYLLYHADQLYKKNILIKNSSTLLEYAFGINPVKINSLFKDSLGEKYSNIYIGFCRECLIEKHALIKNTDTANKIDINDDIWYYNYFSNGEVKTKKLNFETIKNNNLKLVLKHYYKSLIKKQEINKGKTSLFSQIDNYFRNVKSVTYFIDTYCILSFKDIKMDMIKALYRHLRNRKGKDKKMVGMKTVSTYITSMKLFIEWLIEESGFDYQKPTYNLFVNVRFKKLDNTIKNTEIIAKEVMDDIPKNINEVGNEAIGRIIIIMINTPRRFKEIAYLTEDCLDFKDKDGKQMLRYIPWKVIEAKLARDPNNQYEQVYVNDVVINEIKAQIENTKELREINKIKEIFIYKKGKRNFNFIGILDNNKLINKAINKTLAVDLRKEINVTTRQFRKTIVIEMILNGSTVEEIKTELGHSNKKTTERYYAEADKLLIADKNTVRFKEEFEKAISKENLEEYTESEREQLFNHYCTEYRKVFYKRTVLGLCKRNIFKPCLMKDTNKTISCASCKKLCAGTPNLEAWTELRDDSLKSKNELDNFYKDNLKLQYEQYKEFEEYKELLEDIKSYLNVINAIKGRGISNEV
ncbi:MAG: tyrosine-type recombinase/integrase [Clostridium sp.]|uniref:tyrosine-type recombinase/integrase n=1 Tax=Clostridium sp. TaxID=1506 RepID=UPI003D6D7B0A